MSVKKQKAKNLNDYLSLIPDIQNIRISSDIFYGVFLGLCLLLTGLFLGASSSVQAMEQPVKIISPEQFRLERDVEKMVEGYPIEKMIPYMGTRDRETVAYLVGIAKKESNWGKRVPVTENGEDCYNYWG